MANKEEEKKKSTRRHASNFIDSLINKAKVVGDYMD